MPSSEKQKRAALEAAFAHYVMDTGYPYGSGRAAGFSNSGHTAAKLGLRMTNENAAAQSTAKPRIPQTGA